MHTFLTINEWAKLIIARQKDLIPAISLLEFPLLAQYCNDMLTALNEIRRTTPLMAISSLTNTMNDSFQRISNAISKYYRYYFLLLFWSHRLFFVDATHKSLENIITHSDSFLWFSWSGSSGIRWALVGRLWANWLSAGDVCDVWLRNSYSKIHWAVEAIIPLNFSFTGFRIFI